MQTFLAGQKAVKHKGNAAKFAFFCVHMCNCKVVLCDKESIIKLTEEVGVGRPLSSGD